MVHVEERTHPRYRGVGHVGLRHRHRQRALRAPHREPGNTGVETEPPHLDAAVRKRVDLGVVGGKDDGPHHETVVLRGHLAVEEHLHLKGGGSRLERVPKGDVHAEQGTQLLAAPAPPDVADQGHFHQPEAIVHRVDLDDGSLPVGTVVNHLDGLAADLVQLALVEVAEIEPAHDEAHLLQQLRPGLFAAADGHRVDGGAAVVVVGVGVADPLDHEGGVLVD